MVDQPSEAAVSGLPAGSETGLETILASVQDLQRQNQALTAEIEQLHAELEQVRRASIPWNWISHPLLVLAVSMGAGLAFAGFIIVDNELGFSPGRHGFYLYYMVPLAAPFVAFLLDRAARLRDLRWIQWAVDAFVIILGLVRALSNLPGISGHALFLAYALLTVRSRTARVLITAVLAEVVYLKVFAWKDITLVGGIIAAGIAAVLFYLPYWVRRNIGYSNPARRSSDRATNEQAR